MNSVKTFKASGASRIFQNFFTFQYSSENAAVPALGAVFQ